MHFTTNDIDVSQHEATGHLIPAGDNDETLVLTRCGGHLCENCKRRIPVQRYKFFRTQWLPLDMEVEFKVREVR